MQPNEIDELLKKYDAGEATEEEKMQLAELIEEQNSFLNAVLDELQIHKLKAELEANQ
jgi:hypothetical protein